MPGLADASGGRSTYQYDALFRLTQVTYPGPTTDTYSYDPAGNRLTKNTSNYTYDAAGQMLTAGIVTYGYDANGNQTSRVADTFTYGHENRLTQSVIGGVTSSSTYNGDGLRMSHTVSGQTTNYTCDVAADLPVVLQDGTQAPSQVFIEYRLRRTSGEYNLGWSAMSCERNANLL